MTIRSHRLLADEMASDSSSEHKQAGRTALSMGIAENERPVRGDNRTGQSHMGAWGGWALAPNIAMGRYVRSHINWSPGGRPAFKASRVFLASRQCVSRRDGPLPVSWMLSA